MSTATESSIILNALEQQVEQHLQLAIHTFQNLDEAILFHPAANNGWSIAQCLWHLNSYGDYYLPRISKGLSGGKRSESSLFKSTWLGAYFIRMMLPTSGKKYKAFKDHVPPSHPDAYPTVAEFIHQQELLLSYIQQSRQVDMNTIRIPISIASYIRLKLGDVLQFIVAHDERHLQQALRNTQQVSAKQ
jgi:hypothetical protein